MMVTAQQYVLDATVATATSVVLMLNRLCQKTFDCEPELQMKTRLLEHP
jgi:hypothetical protein